MELDTGQLNSVLSRALGSAFGGTYPRDLIPHRLRPYERAVVINTDKHDQPGTHWVCVYVVPPVVEYFDSYGFRHFLPEILDFIERHQSTPVWNPFDYQSLNTTVCGQYCVYYLLQRHKRKKTVQEWMLPFPPSTPMHQDCYIARWFLEKFHPPPHHYGQRCQCFYSNPPHL